MKLKSNELKIIQLLLSADSYLSSYEIASSTGISRRKVRDEMKIVKDILDSLHLNLLSKTSSGYYIEGKSSKNLAELENIINKNDRNDDNAIPTLPYERTNYILIRLINSKDYIKLDTLADELLVSRATIVNDFIGLKKEIKKYHITITQKPKYGVIMEGPEEGKRAIIVDQSFRNMSISNMYFDFIDCLFKSSDKVIIDIIKAHQINISDISLIDFLIGFSTCISRVSKGFMINHPVEQFSHFENRPEYYAVLDLAHYSREHFQTILPEYEIQRLTIQLICKRSTKGIISAYHPDIIAIENEILHEIESQTCITFHDAKFLNTLQICIEYTLMRQKYNEKIRTPLYIDIQYDCPLAYYLAKVVSCIIKKHTGRDISSSELTNFALLFNNSIDNKKLIQKKALFINCMREPVRTFVYDYVDKELHSLISITKSIHYFEIDQENLDDYDLILSTAPIHKSLPIPVISISYLITKDDIIRIKSYLSYLFNDKQFIYYFHPAFYQRHVQVKTMKGLASTFYSSIKKVYHHLDESKKNDMMNTNLLSIHTFNNSIALIRLSRPLNANNIVAMVICEQPISIQENTFQIAFLISSVESHNTMYNTLFSALKNTSEKKEDMDKLLLQPSYPEFLKIILNNSYITTPNKKC